MTPEDPEPLDVQGLVQRASAGDAPSVEALLTRYLPRLRTYVRLRVNAAIRQRESSSDLVQTVCREVLQHADAFQYDGEEKFRAWLFKTALNKILERNRYHRAQRRDAHREVAMASGGDSPDLGTPQNSASQVAMAGELAERMEQAFDLLPEDYREVITLARIVGLPHAEIAVEMERTEGAVAMLLSRALVAYVEAMDRISGKR